MAAINKHTDAKGKTTYRARIRLKGSPTVSATFDRLTDAKAWARTTDADIRAGRYMDKMESQRRTLTELLDVYEKRKLPAKGKTTAIIQKAQLAWWRAEMGCLTLANVTPAKINDCMNKLTDSGHAGSTVNRYLAVLSHAFTYAVKDLEWMNDSPMRKVTKPKEPRGRVRFLSSDVTEERKRPDGSTEIIVLEKGERTRLLDACKASSNALLYPAALLAVSTGMRRGEQFSLTWRTVDTQTGRIILEDTKNSERRTVIATGPALDELRKLGKVRLLDNDHVFPGKVKGKPMDLTLPWERALKAAEIADFRWHDLRHSFASELAMSGATLAEIAEAMGHKTLSMVKRYSHLTEGHISKVVERMTARVFGGEA